MLKLMVHIVVKEESIELNTAGNFPLKFEKDECILSIIEKSFCIYFYFYFLYFVSDFGTL